MAHKTQDTRWELRLHEQTVEYEHTFKNGNRARRVDHRMGWSLFLGGQYICEGTAENEKDAVKQASGQVQAYHDPGIEQVHDGHKTIVLDHEQIMVAAKKR